MLMPPRTAWDVAVVQWARRKRTLTIWTRMTSTRLWEASSAAVPRQRAAQASDQSRERARSTAWAPRWRTAGGSLAESYQRGGGDDCTAMLRAALHDDRVRTGRARVRGVGGNTNFGFGTGAPLAPAPPQLQGLDLDTGAATPAWPGPRPRGSVARTRARFEGRDPGC